MRFDTPHPAQQCDVLLTLQVCTQVIAWVGYAATEALMFARPFRYVAPALAALSLIALRLASPFLAPAASPPPGAPEDRRVVFRHFL
ncbi:hypothetical protein MKK67_23960 [Methylobacterium sp. J-072]|uniref:hypothetical protein n=1 Tax=Methylobacterium sp. J-072 TaxID=2836651 RepID=UPI001FB94CC3|nr:hypothetical protein [Methylobacterium sp. J-072]MCJ2095530.1 hypothetical protein [Methylobacterium sp. J-072]